MSGHPLDGMNFTQLERDLINWFVSYSPHPTLAAQLRAASPRSREYTGAGMNLRLAVPESAGQPLPAALKSPIRGPQISAPSLPNGGGALLFHAHGVVGLLEVYTYTDPLPEDLSGYSLHAV